MMREARIPHVTCGRPHNLRSPASALGLRALLSFVFLLFGVSAGFTQDPSIANPGSRPSSFPQQPGGPLGGPLQKIDRSKPLYLQGDELIYDTKGNSVRARGNVEIFYNNYVLKADEVQYDQAASTLTAAIAVR